MTDYRHYPLGKPRAKPSAMTHVWHCPECGEASPHIDGTTGATCAGRSFPVNRNHEPARMLLRALAPTSPAPEPSEVNPGRAPMVETRYGTLPVGTRFEVVKGRVSGPAVWELHTGHWHLRGSGYRYPLAERFGSGEIIPPLAHDEAGWPIYAGDRVRTSLGPEGMAWGHPTRPLGVHVAGEDGTPDWVIAVSDGTTLRKIHDEPAP